MRCDAIRFDAIRFDAIRFDAIRFDRILRDSMLSARVTCRLMRMFIAVVSQAGRRDAGNNDDVEDLSDVQQGGGRGVGRRLARVPERRLRAHRKGRRRSAHPNLARADFARSLLSAAALLRTQAESLEHV